jgi:magnesium transporter
VEDAIHAHQRPKLEVYDDMVLLVLKTARYVDPTEVIELGELLVFLGDDYIITVRHGEASSLSPVREALEHDPGHLRHGPGAVLHAILDRVVDDYGPAIQGLETDIDEVEDELFSGERTNPAERIYRLQREVLQFRKATAPLVEPIERLAEGRYAQIHPEIRDYFRDVNDHLIRTRDQLDAMRDLLAGSLQANLAQVAVRQNDDVRRISAWVAIIAVPTAIAGIYGMNFEHMPELKWELGYPGAVLVMLTICTLLYRYFRRAGWL